MKNKEYTVQEFAALIQEHRKSQLEKLDQEQKDILEKFNQLSKEKQEELCDLVFKYKLPNIPDKQNPEITKEQILDLHKYLVQCCINYLVENKITEIDRIDFIVDGLLESLENNEWSSYTDSSLGVYGIGKEGYERLGNSM